MSKQPFSQRMVGYRVLLCRVQHLQNIGCSGISLLQQQLIQVQVLPVLFVFLPPDKRCQFFLLLRREGVQNFLQVIQDDDFKIRKLPDFYKKIKSVFDPIKYCLSAI
jgi:hypothetical protein